MKKILMLLILSFICSQTTLADEITKQIEISVKAYNEGNYKAALDELKFAMGQIQKKADKQHKKLLPEALEGWIIKKTRSNSAAMSMIGGGTSIERDYRKDQQRVKIKIMANTPAMGFMMMAINNPMVAAADENTELFRSDSEYLSKAYVTY